MKPVSLLTTTALAALLASLAHPVLASPQACAGLANTGFPNTLITQAQWQAAGVVTLPTGVLPAHCEIQGKINQRVGADGKHAIGFHLRLPKAWNGRFLFQTQGGNDGNLGTGDGTPGGGAPSTVNQGYATVTTDAGHVPENVPVIGEQLYGLDPQARVDYGYNSDGTVGRLSKQIIAAYYGRSPRYSYIMGCSNGGRHAMVASQRFPHLFEGYVAGDPGFNLPAAAVAEAWDTQAFASVAPLYSDGKPILSQSFSNDDLTLVANAVLQRCDKLDGLVDGMIDNPQACRFDPAELQCQGGKTDSCLSPQQVKVLKKVFAGAKNSSGHALYADWPYDAGIGAPGWRVWKIGFPPAPPASPSVPTGINATLGGPSLPYIFLVPPVPVALSNPPLAQEPALRAIFDYLMGFNFDTDAPKIFATSDIYTESPDSFMTAKSTDYRTFRRLGNKLLIYHGVSDPVFSVNDMIGWYERLAEANHGFAPAKSFARLFLVAGMNHCGGGPATDTFDALTPIVNWVEHGVAPRSIIARANPGSPWPTRTRPLCVFPWQARYDGSGSIENAANFKCVKPKHHHDREGRDWKDDDDED